MSRKLTVMALFVVSLVMISWSIDVVAEEKEDKSREAQIQQVREQIKELESALERESDEEGAAKLKEKLQERRKEVESLMGEVRKTQKPKEEFPDIQEGIRQARANLEELRRAAKTLREEGGYTKKLEELEELGLTRQQAEKIFLREEGDTEKLEELREKIGKEERKLVELNALLKKRRAGAKQKKPKTSLMFFRLEHANGENLNRIIGKFLTPAGIIMTDEDTNTLVVKDTPDGLEAASEIVKNLDIPGRRATRERAERPRDRAESEDFFFGTVLEAGEGSLTIKTRDSGETVTLHVPVRRKDDGTSVVDEELSKLVASFQAGTQVRVQYNRGEDKLWIQRVTKTR